MAFFGLGAKKVPKPQDLVKTTKDQVASYDKERSSNGKNVDKVQPSFTRSFSSSADRSPLIPIPIRIPPIC